MFDYICVCCCIHVYLDVEITQTEERRRIKKENGEKERVFLILDGSKQSRDKFISQ